MVSNNIQIVSKVALEYTDCLIGNSYEQKLGLKNVGDVNYPLSLHLEKEYGDISFHPKTLVLPPFADGTINISFTPSRQTKTTITLVISSPYSTHKIPTILHAGTANLSFNSETLQFGMFEKKSKPQQLLKIRNDGTVLTSYTVSDVVKPSMFQLGNSKGILQPGKTAEVTVTFIKQEVCTFHERLLIKTDLINKNYYVSVKGNCEEAVVHEDEINYLNLGTCPVLDPSTAKLNIKNYGKFPLSFTIKSAYPLKVSPAQGEIPGGESRPLTVTWNPSGAYELRTNITIMSNIGNINVTGKLLI